MMLPFCPAGLPDRWPDQCLVNPVPEMTGECAATRHGNWSVRLALGVRRGHMIRNRSALLAFGLLLMVNTSQAREFAEGQVWTYKTRPGEEGSTLQINRIEEHAKLGRIYHISVTDLHVRTPQVRSGFVSELPHLPVSEKTLEESAPSLSAVPPRKIYFESGYAEWNRAQGGVFTIAVSEIISVIEKSVSSGSE